jgi:nucleotide-binding universal stress UspA family protein
MSIVLAALDASPSARPVLETALAVGELTGAAVEAVHVHDGPPDTPEWLAERAAVPLRVLDGPAEDALLEAVSAAEVSIAVLGARATPGGRRPAGRTALHVLQRADKPVVVVPPEALRPRRPLRRLLVPLEGSATSSEPVTQVLGPLLAVDAELVVWCTSSPPRRHRGCWTAPGATWSC